MSTDLDDRNLQAIKERREMLHNKAQLSGQLAETDVAPDLEEELMEVGMKSEAADVFAAMLAEESRPDNEDEARAQDQSQRQRDM